MEYHRSTQKNRNTDGPFRKEKNKTHTIIGSSPIFLFVGWLHVCGGHHGHFWATRTARDWLQCSLLWFFGARAAYIHFLYICWWIARLFDGSISFWQNDDGDTIAIEKQGMKMIESLRFYRLNTFTHFGESRRVDQEAESGAGDYQTDWDPSQEASDCDGRRPGDWRQRTAGDHPNNRRHRNQTGRAHGGETNRSKRNKTSFPSSLRHHTLSRRDDWVVSAATARWKGKTHTKLALFNCFVFVFVFFFCWGVVSNRKRAATKMGQWRCRQRAGWPFRVPSSSGRNTRRNPTPATRSTNGWKQKRSTIWVTSLTRY